MASNFVSEKNLKFLIYDVFDAVSLTAYDKYGDHRRQTFDMVLDATVKLAKDLCLPTLKEMDEYPPELQNGRVKVHAEVRRFMRACGEGGWIGAGFPYELEGEQLPHLITCACGFIFAAANYSMSVYPFLTAGAARLIGSFGSKALIDTYLPPMLAGHWQGTMALTEPQAGSSLADIVTEAVPTGEGDYRIQGKKIFISAGDHDGADNVIHLLLARIPGAPAGVKGISLFVVPKQRPGANGALEPNDVEVSQIYHKLGYRGCPITELEFGQAGDCRGTLVGEPHKGLFYMFQMMNEARLEVGLGAAAIAQAAYGTAVDYTALRPQGRPLTGKDPAAPQVPIVHHPDVKRMLLFQKAVVEGSLSLLLQCARYADLAIVSGEEEKEKYALLMDLLTPVAKSYPSEMGILSTSQAIQCLGGYGYCEDFPVEQYYRDVRIHPIHEGTTGIQGMDLLGRKITMHDGRAFALLIEQMQQTIADAGGLPDLSEQADDLSEAVDLLLKVLAHLKQVSAAEGAEAYLSDATVFLEFFSIIVIAWQWLLQAVHAATLKDRTRKKADARFCDAKRHTCRYFFKYELPKIFGLSRTLMSGLRPTMEINPEQFNT